MLRVAQISDVQIRNFQRHAEFRESFENLYVSLREKCPDFIVLVGDIAQSKTHISPEFVQICSEFFTELAKIAQLVIIPGNHDANLANLTRLDALTPIVDALNNPRINYYKDSGVYTWRQGVDFYVFSCFDENWPDIKAPVGTENAVRIGLYHGMVKDAILQNGVRVTSCPYTKEDFLKIVDYLFLGDIHRMQILDWESRAAYCGSLVQQNYGESTDKGYLIWDIEGPDKHEVDFVKLPNVCPYYTIDLPDDLKLAKKLPIQEGARIRVVSRALTPNEQNDVSEEVKEIYKPVFDPIFKDKINAHTQDVKISKGIKIEDLTDVGVQDRLIRDWLKEQNLSDDILDQITELNKKYDSAVRRNEDVIRNIQYKVKKVSWSNLFSYGENNCFDFSERKGVVGVFGKNAVGKSSFVVDVPLYAMFNTNSKGVVKNDDLINDKKTTCDASIEIEIGDLTYKLERDTHIYLKSGKRKGKPVYQGKTNLSFTIYDKDGVEVENRDGLERDDTDKEVRKIFGTADDFMATSVAPQWRLLDFIAKKSTERQKIIARYFDVDTFQKKHALANEYAKDLKGLLKTFEFRDLEKEKHEIVVAVKTIDEKLDAFKSELIRYEEMAKRFSTDADHWDRKILKVAIDEFKSEEQLNVEIMLNKVSVIDKKNEVDNLEHKQKKLAERLEELLEKIEKTDIRKLEKEKSKLIDELGHFDYSQLDMDMEIFQERKKTLGGLDKYSCITNDDCCMLIEIKRVKKDQAITVVKILEAEVNERHCDALRRDKIDPLSEKISEHYSDIDVSLDLTKRLKTQEKLTGTQRELVEKVVTVVHALEKQRDLLVENKKQLEDNAEYKLRVYELREKEREAVRKGNGLDVQIYELEWQRKDLWKKHDEVVEAEKSYQETKAEYDAYYHYLETMGKDGLSRAIIQNNLGIINTELDKILSGNVDFEIELEMSEVGKIDVYFKSQKSKSRIIELCCGMEKTIAAICIRAALVSVTTLPKANIFVLDEVFTALDPEYMDATRKILQYLKNLFDSVIIITHIDQFRDFCDHVVEVVRDDQGFARII